MKSAKGIQIQQSRILFAVNKWTQSSLVNTSPVELWRHAVLSIDARALTPARKLRQSRAQFFNYQMNATERAVYVIGLHNISARSFH